MMESIKEENELDENNNNIDTPYHQYFNSTDNLKQFLASNKFWYFSKESECSKIKVI